MNFENGAESVRFPHIALELKNMVAIDQDMRIRSQTEGYWDETVDEKHAQRMKEIILEIGWPTVSKVGKDGAHNAWLLIQHADHDVNFQAQCLQSMKDMLIDEVAKTDIAYLEDRVRINQGRGQLYGTQFRQENGTHIPEPIEDEANVDARRNEMGMGTLAEGIQEMYDQYPNAGKA